MERPPHHPQDIEDMQEKKQHNTVKFIMTGENFRSESDLIFGICNSDIYIVVIPPLKIIKSWYLA